MDPASQEPQSKPSEKTSDPTSPPSAVPYTVFEPNQRRYIVLLCALAGFFSPFSAFTYFPAIEYISKDLNVSLQLMNLTVTVYLVVQGIVPAFFGDLADQIGRRPVYLVILAIYAGSCVGLALQRSYPLLLVFRMLQSAGSSGTIALGSIVVADLAPPHDRGRYIGAMLTGPNTGPSLGPVAGGVLAEKAGWHWIFWVLAILGVFVLIPFVLSFPETCRTIVGNGRIPATGVNKPLMTIGVPNVDPRVPYEGPLSEGRRWQRIPNPFNCLKIIFTKKAGFILASNATFYLLYSCIQTALAPALMLRYGLNSLEAGLCFLPYGIATISSSYLIGKVMDHDYKVTARQFGIVINTVSGDDLSKFPIERARLRSMPYYVLGSVLSSIGLGWSIDRQTHLSAPMILLFFCGVATTGVFTTSITLIVDIHPVQAGLASVSVNLTRCTAAAVGVVALQPLLDSVGIGWTFTILGAICLVSVPMLVAVRQWGSSWRNAGAPSEEGIASQVEA